MIPTKRLSSGFELPVLGLGTWQMGGRREVDTSHDEQDITAIRAAIEHGITLIDTAESYGVGHAEELVGQAILDYDRSRLFITSKVSQGNLRPDDLWRSLEATLHRLDTDYLDLYLIHAPNDAIPLLKTIGALDKAVDDGLVRWIGVSNFSKERLSEAQRLTHHPIVVNQVYYNVRSRGVETTELLEYCQQHEVLLQAFRPIDKGALLADPPMIIREQADRYHKTPVQIMLNWLISQPNVTTLIKSLNLTHLNENLGAIGWSMEPSDIERLRREYPNQEPTSADFPPR